MFQIHRGLGSFVPFCFLSELQSAHQWLTGGQVFPNYYGDMFTGKLNQKHLTSYLLTFFSWQFEILVTTQLCQLEKKMVLLQKLNYSTSEVAVRKAREIQARTGLEPWPLWRWCSTQPVELCQANREQVVIWVQLIAHWLWMYIYAWISCINSHHIMYDIFHCFFLFFYATPLTM